MIYSLYNFKTPHLYNQTPITKQKGPKGRQKNNKLAVNQRRSKISYWVKFNSSNFFFQNKPTLLYSTKLLWEHKLHLFFFKSAKGLIYVHKNLNTNLFSFYMTRFGTFIPKQLNCVYSKHLIFLKINSKLTNIRDLFNENYLLSTAFKSTSVLKNIDWWFGFALIILPSNNIKLLFYLSKAEKSFFDFLSFDLNNRFKMQWAINWRKAGLYSNLGRKPKVRGVAKNPVDHPHGGRTKSIRFPRTPWGKPTKLK